MPLERVACASQSAVACVLLTDLLIPVMLVSVCLWMAHRLLAHLLQPWLANNLPCPWLPTGETHHTNSPVLELPDALQLRPSQAASRRLSNSMATPPGPASAMRTPGHA